MSDHNTSTSATKASIILHAGPKVILAFLDGSGFKVSSINDTNSNGIEHKTQVYTGSMGDLYTLFQKKKNKLLELMDSRVRFECLIGHC